MEQKIEVRFAAVLGTTTTTTVKCPTATITIRTIVTTTTGSVFSSIPRYRVSARDCRKKFREIQFQSRDGITVQTATNNERLVAQRTPLIYPHTIKGAL